MPWHTEIQGIQGRGSLFAMGQIQGTSGSRLGLAGH